MLDCENGSSTSKITVNAEVYQKRKFEVKNIIEAPDDIVPWEVGLIKENCYIFEENLCLVDEESHDDIPYFGFTRS